MAIFNRYFTVLFRLKTKWISFLLMIQLIASLAMTYFNMGEEIKHYQSTTPVFVRVTLIWLAFYLFSSILFSGIFYIYTCVQNERVSGNQTWRLVPISDSKLYFDNILSSFVAVIFFILVEIIVLAVIVGIASLMSPNFREIISIPLADIGKSFQQVNAEVIFNLLSSVMLIILTILFGYFLVSFLNYTSKSLLDFLPASLSKRYVQLICIAVIILVAWLALKASGVGMSILSFPYKLIIGETLDSNSQDQLLALTIMVIIDLAFWLVDTFLFNKFFEAHENK